MASGCRPLRAIDGRKAGLLKNPPSGRIATAGGPPGASTPPSQSAPLLFHGASRCRPHVAARAASSSCARGRTLTPLCFATALLHLFAPRPRQKILFAFVGQMGNVFGISRGAARNIFASADQEHSHPCTDCGGGNVCLRRRTGRSRERQDGKHEPLPAIPSGWSKPDVSVQQIRISQLARDAKHPVGVMIGFAVAPAECHTHIAGRGGPRTAAPGPKVAISRKAR